MCRSVSWGKVGKDGGGGYVRLKFITRAEITMGQQVMGQMGQQYWMGHVGHGSVLMTH